MSQSLNALANDLTKIECEIKSNKKTTRYKSLEKLDYICSQRSTELTDVLNGRKKYQRSSESTWTSLFEATHEAIVQHTQLFVSCRNDREITTFTNKSRDHIVCMEKIINLSQSTNNSSISICLTIILEKIFQCFADRTMTEYFGMHYLKMLIRNILNSSKNLHLLQIDDWNKMLSLCFPLYEYDVMQKPIVLECISLIIEKGNEFSHLNYELFNYRQTLESILCNYEQNSSNVNDAKQIVINVTYNFCKIVALDFRYALCEFMEKVLDKIKVYDQHFDNDTKKVLFKLLHLTLIIHCPDVGGSNQSAEYVYDANLWNKHLRKMYSIVQNELKYIYNKISKIQSNVEFNKEFIEFTSRLCSMIFWNSSVWTIENSDTSQPNEKRRKCCNKLQSLFDLIDLNDNQTGFGWMWLVILSKLLQKYPDKFEANDFQPLLYLLEDFPSTIKYSIQIEIFTDIITVMLSKESEFLKSNKFINESRCEQIWTKIIEMIFRKSVTNTPDSILYLKCLKILIEYNKIPSTTFANSIIQAFITNAVKKSNEGLECLITLLKTYSIETINNGSESITSILHWLHFKDAKIHLMECMNKINIKIEILADLTAVCLLSKIDNDQYKQNNNFVNIKDEFSLNIHNDSQHFEILEKSLLFKSLDKMIIAEISPIDYDPNRDIIDNQMNFTLPLQCELKTIINEFYLEKLYTLIGGLSREFDQQTDQIEYFIYLLSTLELAIAIVNRLLHYDALDEQKFQNCFLIKRIYLRLSEIQMFCDIIFGSKGSIIDLRKSIDIFEHLTNIFVKDKNHPKIDGILKSWKCTALFDWIENVVLSKVLKNSEYIKIFNLENFSIEHKFRYDCIIFLSYFCDQSTMSTSTIGDDGDDDHHHSSFKIISDHHFNFSSNEDLFIIFELITIISKQKSDESKAIWINECMKMLCTKYYKIPEISEKIMDILKNVIYYLSAYECLTDDLLQIISSFLIMLKKKRYGPRLTEKFIRIVKHVGRAYPESLQLNNFSIIFQYLENFLKYNNLLIQYTTIETLSFVFDKNWLLSSSSQSSQSSSSSSYPMDNENYTKRFNLKIFFKNLYDKLNINMLFVVNQTDVSNENCSDKDEINRLASVHLQLYSTIICKCFMLSKWNWFYLAKFCYKQKFEEAKAIHLIHGICKYLNIKQSSLMNLNIKFLIGMWLKCSYSMAKFPWYISGCDTKSDFFLDYVNCISLSVLSYQPNAFDDFVKLYDGQTKEGVLKPITMSCLASIIPSLAKCSRTPIRKREIITEIETILKENILNLNEMLHENWLEIIENLLNILWDNEKYMELFDLEIDYLNDDDNADDGDDAADDKNREGFINFIGFQKSIEYIQKNLLKNDQNLFRTASIKNFIQLQKLLNKIKYKIQNSLFSEEKFMNLFRYCTIIDEIGNAIFLGIGNNEMAAAAAALTKKNNEMQKLNGFILRDIIYFICNELLNKFNSLKFKYAVCKYFYRFLTIILNNNNSSNDGGGGGDGNDNGSNLTEFLNIIVSSIIPLIIQQQQQNEYLSKIALELLELLIIENSTGLHKAISLLDNFPLDPAFNRLRNIHMAIKYNDKLSSLSDEIEYFLKIDKRQISGISSLCTHLATKKPELVKMYKELEHGQIYRFSEDYENNNLHRLILTLLNIVRDTDEDKKCLEAVKCLGELGPSDLATVILKPDIQLSTYKFKFTNFTDASIFFYNIILEQLNSLHLHADANILICVTKACEHIFKTQIGRKLSDKYPELYPYFMVTDKPKFTSIFIEPQTVELQLMKIVEGDIIFLQHSVWLKQFTKELFLVFGDKLLLDIANYHILFAEITVPLLIHLLLTCENQQYPKCIEQLIEYFFQKHFEMKNNPINDGDGHDSHENGSTESKNNTQTIFMNKSVIKTMLNIVECVRMYNLKTSKCIPLNYMHIAQAAQYCEAYFSSIMYGELWVLDQQATKTLALEELKRDPVLQNNMLEAYKSIGNTDACIPFLNPITSRFEYLKMNNLWNRMYIEYDALLLINQPQQNPLQQMNNCNGNLIAYKNILSQSGLYSLANRIQTVKDAAATTTTTTNDYNDYNCAWRLGDWKSIIINNTKNNMNLTSTTTIPISSSPSSSLIIPNNLQQLIEKQHYIALKCLDQRDEMGIKISIEMARNLIITSIRASSLECTNNIYKHLSMLHMLQQIEDFCDIQFGNSIATQQQPPTPSMNILAKWKFHDTIACSSFKYREPILAQRLSILKCAGIRATRKLENLNAHRDIVPNALLKLAIECRHENENNLAIRHLATLNAMSDLPIDVRAQVLLEDSQLNWQLNDQLLAKKLLYEIIVAKQYQNTINRVLALRLYGEYLAQSFSENVKCIIDRFFDGSLKFLQNISNKKLQLAQHWGKTFLDTFDEFERVNKLNNYLAISRYADREYQQLVNYMKSDVFEKKKKHYELNVQREKGLVAGGVNSNKDNELLKQRFILRQQLMIDKQEIKNTEKEYAEYLCLALENYILCCRMKTDELYNLEIFRIISLWFSNGTNEKVLAILKQHLNTIESYKFLCVIPQIAARMNNRNDDFSELVAGIMEKCALEHPHHTLHQILALSNAMADAPGGGEQNKLEPRVVAAKQLINKLKHNESIFGIVSQMEEMSLALIKLANNVLKPNCVNIPAAEPLTKLKNLHFVHCPTIMLPISLTGNYNSIKSIVKWDTQFGYVGGVNAPKKLSCLCSDGKKYSQLLKGRDDLRQDAVMQQVFMIINDLLQAHKETKKCKLTIRTYKVVALSQRSGILEWCDNTIPLGDYLGGTKKMAGAHERYFPDDWKPIKCRETMKNYKNQPNNQKYMEFKNICTNIRPVFQNFFFEHFQIPGTWYERRLSYTNSVATTSMIGYILGIGDRHVSNILLDQSTAEFIHIDFGIAFEQGKCLPTPETIPFRLTRDIVAAFGVSGFDGVFRAGCEKTMNVLRQNKTTILTILEVLLYDPLYAWTLTNEQACILQSIESSDFSDTDLTENNKNSSAERVLLRLEEKLDGKEASGVATVEAQIEFLIQQAVNPTNLCRVFEGWQPYL